MTENEIINRLHLHGETMTQDEAFFIMDALEEIQQYRAIGTVEEIQKKIEELERWHTDRINENIKNPFAYTSTSICHNCDHKDEYIEELESEVAEYKSIGTVDDFKALKEKENEDFNMLLKAVKESYPMSKGAYVEPDVFMGDVMIKFAKYRERS